ncbi:MAG: translation initiation factor [Chitinophagales bacterium]|nr:translation initiation factor [Chitinophagales bacterium]
MSKKNETSLSWDAFQMLGNPDNAPEDSEESESEFKPATQILRVHIERKNRGGKEATVIKGFTCREEIQKDLGKLLKDKLGIGGSVKNDEIILQGDHREKVMSILFDLGYKNAKKAGG